MKIAILSDIHGNYDALIKVLEECEKSNVEKYIFLGDYIGYYYEPKKVWDKICQLNGVKIKGNHENLLKDSLTSKARMRQIKEKYGVGHQLAQNQLSQEDIEKLYYLPEKSEFKLKISVLNLITVAHGIKMHIYILIHLLKFLKKLTIQKLISY